MKRIILGTLFSAALIFPVSSFAQSSSDFLTKAIKGDNSEIMIGKLAEKNGGSAGVRRFGATLVRDHTKAKAQATTVASKMSVTPPTDVMPEAQEEYGKLSKMNGKEFDTEFADYMVKDHQQDIDDFTKEAGTKDGQASSLAAKQLPTLKKHLKLAESLKKSS